MTRNQHFSLLNTPCVIWYFLYILSGGMFDPGRTQDAPERSRSHDEPSSYEDSWIHEFVRPNTKSKPPENGAPATSGSGHKTPVRFQESKSSAKASEGLESSNFCLEIESNTSAFKSRGVLKKPLTGAPAINTVITSNEKNLPAPADPGKNIQKIGKLQKKNIY